MHTPLSRVYEREQSGAALPASTAIRLRPACVALFFLSLSLRAVHFNLLRKGTVKHTRHPRLCVCVSEERIDRFMVIDLQADFWFSR